MNRLPEDLLHNGPLWYEERHTGLCLWSTIEHNVFNSPAHLQADRFNVSIKILRGKIFSHYRAEELVNPDYKLSRMQKMTLNMLGKRNHPVLHGNAGETRCLVRFCKLMQV